MGQECYQPVAQRFGRVRHMTSLLIAASVECELELLRTKLQTRSAGMIGGFSYSVAQVENRRLFLATTGVGIVSAGVAFGALLPTLAVDRAVIIGSAGALPGSGLDNGDVVVASSETLAELGTCDSEGIGDCSSLNLPGLQQSILLDDDLARSLLDAARGPFRARRGACLSVAGASGDLIQAEARAKRFGALAENMEGYSLALAGSRFGIKVGELRAISNQAGVRDKSAWDLDAANERVQTVILRYLERGD